MPIQNKKNVSKLFSFLLFPVQGRAAVESSYSTRVKSFFKMYSKPLQQFFVLCPNFRQTVPEASCNFPGNMEDQLEFGSGQ